MTERLADGDYVDRLDMLWSERYDRLREAGLRVYHGKIGYDHPTDPDILALGAVIFPSRADRSVLKGPPDD